MPGMTVETVLLGVVTLLLLLVAIMLAMISGQLRAVRREVEVARKQLATMDWSVMLLNGVQLLKDTVKGLELIDKRLQKLEAIQKVAASNIDIRAR
jgi:hypothetical protein